MIWLTSVYVEQFSRILLSRNREGNPILAVLPGVLPPCHVLYSFVVVSPLRICWEIRLVLPKSLIVVVAGGLLRAPPPFSLHSLVIGI